MKHTKAKKKKFDPSNGTRAEWKMQAENEVITLLEDIDELGLDAAVLAGIEAAISKAKERLYNTLERLEITPEMVEAQDELTDDILFNMWAGKIVVSDYQRDKMIDITSKDGVFLRVTSLAEQMRIEQFGAELKANPYQLQLIPA